MSSDDLHWTTAITEVQPNALRLRGYRIDELMGEVSFAEAVYLALMGELPAPEVARLLNAMLVSSIDHGATPPSALAARTAASTGAPLNAAIAAGVLSINRHHGGAIESCMETIHEALDMALRDNLDMDLAAAGLVAMYRKTKRRIAGLGHRIHSEDPRTARLFALAEKAGVASDGVMMLRALREALAAATGRRLPINVDGAIAALLVDLDVPAVLANAFFIMARVPGLVAHIHEEKTQQRPMRRIHPTEHSYNGPEARAVGKNK